jgi:hypothetical protein
MPTYLFRDRGGRAIGATEARDRAEAQAIGRRGYPGYSGDPEAVISDENVAESLRESFRTIGLPEPTASLAALGRGEAGRASDPADGLHEGAASGVGGVREMEIREATPLEQAFRAMGLSESAARLAAGGRDR